MKKLYIYTFLLFSFQVNADNADNVEYIDIGPSDYQKINLLTRHWKKLGKDYSVEFINVPEKPQSVRKKKKEQELVVV